MVSSRNLPSAVRDELGNTGKNVDTREALHTLARKPGVQLTTGMIPNRRERCNTLRKNEHRAATIASMFNLIPGLLMFP
jgi:hypothetical protein